VRRRVALRVGQIVTEGMQEYWRVVSIKGQHIWKTAELERVFDGFVCIKKMPLDDGRYAPSGWCYVSGPKSARAERSLIGKMIANLSLDLRRLSESEEP